MDRESIAIKTANCMAGDASGGGVLAWCVQGSGLAPQHCATQNETGTKIPHGILPSSSTLPLWSALGLSCAFIDKLT